MPTPIPFPQTVEVKRTIGELLYKPVVPRRGLLPREGDEYVLCEISVYAAGRRLKSFPHCFEESGVVGFDRRSRDNPRNVLKL